MIAIDLTKQQASDVDPKAIKQINFTGYLSGKNDRLMLFIRNYFRLFTRNCESIVILFCYNIIKK